MAHVDWLLADLGLGQLFRFYRTSLFNPFRCLRRVAASTDTIVLNRQAPRSDITSMCGILTPKLDESFPFRWVDTMGVKWFATPAGLEPVIDALEARTSFHCFILCHVHIVFHRPDSKVCSAVQQVGLPDEIRPSRWQNEEAALTALSESASSDLGRCGI
ncbi:hypothetical protein OG21DRAFT_1514566 [Imleria badia]|nr:hypothetical protein OG21DRAFT_1514566 [Imleria badia]